MYTGKEDFKLEFRRSLIEVCAKPPESCTRFEKFTALSSLVCNMAASGRTDTVQRQIAEKEKLKKVYYFSMEFLIGRLLENYLINLGIRDTVAEGLAEMGESLEEICSAEPDPGLGNGGLGRLAACFLDSMASLDIPAEGMGIRYKFGLFRQKIVDGYQTEEPDAWLEHAYPFEKAYPDETVSVPFGGYVERSFQDGKMKFTHRDYRIVHAVPYYIPIVGEDAHTVSNLCLWQAKPSDDRIDMEAFNRGDYSLAMKEKNEAEAITCILYPDDSTWAGRNLRLKQEYFFVCAGMASVIRQYRKLYGSNAWTEMPEHVAIHINDTHPTTCIPELMRILLDEEGLEWDDAWEITTRTISFTNHTVLPEALEKWPIDMFKSLLPRIYMIVEEIDRRWRLKLSSLQLAGKEVMSATAVLWDGEVRMANLSVIGSHSVNGVAAIHSDILTKTVFRDFYRISPDKFNNKTNGVSHRRFLLQSNPALCRLITSAIGSQWKENMSFLSQLEDFQNDKVFLQDLAEVKRHNKVLLANEIARTSGILVDPDSVFDIQVKRIHAYKRQLLNVFKILELYDEIRKNPDLEINPYTFIFAGKAAQGYAFAKEVIKFINSVADLVNHDLIVSKKIKVVFIENFCVSGSQMIYPAADISEQISTAGKEASGTGCMKFMMNGAVTLGTLDGANVEIREQVGEDNMVIFGLTAEEAMEYSRTGQYDSRKWCRADERLFRMTTQLIDGTFAGSGCDFWGIRDALWQHNDEYFVLRDFDAYMKAWLEMDARYRDRDRWGRMSLANIAHSGFFSSDRTIREYADEIWGIRTGKLKKR